jgi:hypothetical protein
MAFLIDSAWRQDEEPDWPSQAETDECAAEPTEEWEVEENRMRDLRCGPPSSQLPQREEGDHQEEAS